MIISERIFMLLKEKGISQKEFAEATGIAQSTISDWKRKKTNPASDKIMAICDVLQIDPVTLLSGTESDNFKKPDYLILEKDSPEYEVAVAFREMDLKSRNRVEGYIAALKGE